VLQTSITVKANQNSGWLNERQDRHQKLSDFRFLVEPSDTVAAKNNPVGPILHCAAETGDDYPKPTVKWRRDGQSLKFPDFNDRRQLLSNGSLYFSTIETSSDEGLYQCMVSVNGIGTMISRTARLKIADSPQFDAEPSDDVRVFLGQTATFECRVSEESAIHQPQITWLKDDQPLILDHRMKIIPAQDSWKSLM